MPRSAGTRPAVGGGPVTVATGGPTVGPGHDPTAATLEDQLGFRLGRTHRLVREGWETLLAGTGLSAPQSAVLRALADSPATGLRELARRLHTDPMNVRRLVDRLEAAGLVTTSNAPDHRQRRAVELTPAGDAACRDLAERADAWERTLVQLIGRERIEALRSLLAVLDDALGTAAVPGNPDGGRR